VSRSPLTMCVGFWSLDDPVYSLILCANRDEFLARPALPAHFHNFDVEPRLSKDEVEISSDSEGSVLSGVDIEGGGTWIGINKTGQIGFLTNITETLNGTNYPVSRGSLAQHYLACSYPTSLPLLQYLEENYDEEKKHLETAGFNFVLFSPKSSASSHFEYEAALLTNHCAGGPLAYRSISASECRCGGISNAIDGSPVDGLGRPGSWLKVDVGCEKLERILSARRTSESQQGDQEEEAALVEDLMELMGWTSSSFEPSQDHLRDSIFIPPFSVAAQKSSPSTSDAAIAPPVQRSRLNGTRLTTVILVRRDGRVCFVERDRSILRGNGDEVELFGPRGKLETQRLYRFHIQQSTARQHIPYGQYAGNNASACTANG